ncbi:MAG: homoserine kinase, partial [Chloroflexota bacterium]|nr:homoserine kinase [Chloroflexota bacterium]
MDKFTVRVPATSANLGPGFDCLGLALDIYNFVTVSRSSSFSLSVSGEGADVLPRSPENLLYRSLAALYKRVGSPLPPL